MAIVLYPTAGHILDVAHGAGPTRLEGPGRDYLRGLAARVAEIAAHPRQEERRSLWYRHNRLEKVRAPLLVWPEGCWGEIMGEDELRLEDPFWAQWEWYLKHVIYRDASLPDDLVVEPCLYVVRVVRMGDWGLRSKRVMPDLVERRGAWRYDPPLKNPDDLGKLVYPTVEVDEDLTERILEVTNEVFAGILPVRAYYPLAAVNMITEATELRGIDQFMTDMYDRPEWLHELMGFIAEGRLRQYRWLEQDGRLSLNNRNFYIDSGGIGYSTELPAPGFDGKRVRLCDLWGFGVAQEMALVSPAQHEEFVLNYQLRVLEYFGLNSYGCCEPLTRKFGMAKKIPRLRRVSVSPWCDIEAAARELQDKYIFSWKPNPAMLVGGFDPGTFRRCIKRTLEVARDCVLEVIIKDTFTIDRDPGRLEAAVRIAREEIDSFY